MKGLIKKLKHFPVTLTSAVFKEGTNTSLEDVLQEYDAVIAGLGGCVSYGDTLAKYSDKLSTYKGVFDTANQSTLRQGSVGDYWVYKGDQPIKIDSNVLYPNGIVYLDTVTSDGEPINGFRTIYVPFETHGVPREKYDVIIVGAGAGGIGAAYALKDSGLRVAIIERLDTLGGTHCNAGVGLLLGSPVGNWYKDICQQAYDAGMLDFRADTRTNYKEVGGGTTFEKRWRGALFTDAKSVINGFSGNHLNINDYWFSNKYYDDLKHNIDIFINTEVVETHAADGKVYEVKAINTLTGKDSIFVADYFIDCSADAALFRTNKYLTLGTDYYSGTDGRARFSETAYSEAEEPDVYGINTVEPVFIFMSKLHTNGYVQVDNPEWRKTYDNTAYRANFQYTPPGADYINQSFSYGTGMSGKDYLEKSIAWNMGDAHDRALDTFLKSGYATGNRFGGIRKMLAIRESYRVACEKTLDQTYLGTQIASDNIASEKIMALSTWYVDIHNQSYTCGSNICNGIPYASMIPKCYTNVLVASRCYGASHIGLSSVRLVKTMLDLGYSAGKAMARAVKSQIDVRDVDTAQVQADTGIADTMNEVETYFYSSTVNYTEVTE